MNEKISKDDLIDFLMVGKCNADYQSEIYDALLTVIEEKTDAENMRTPKKVIRQVFEDDDGNKITCLECPTCRINLFEYDSRRHVTYCRNCGQALDWSEVENESET